VFHVHELVTSEDLYVTYLKKKMHIFSEGQRSGSSEGEQARYALSELPCGSFIKGAMRSHLNRAISLWRHTWLKNWVNCAV